MSIIILIYIYCLRLYCLYAALYYCKSNFIFNHPINKICWPIISVIFGKVLYLIPQKIPSKRYGKLRGHYTYIRWSDYQIARSLCPHQPLKKRQLKKESQPPRSKQLPIDFHQLSFRKENAYLGIVSYLPNFRFKLNMITPSKLFEL